MLVVLRHPTIHDLMLTTFIDRRLSILNKDHQEESGNDARLINENINENVQENPSYYCGG